MHPWKLAALVAASLVLLASSAWSAEAVGTARSDVLIGADDDDANDPEIQPAGTAANQSLNDTDVLLGRGGDDVLIGMKGNDVLDGGSGGRDALVFGTIDRDTTTNVPILSPVKGRHAKTGLPTANVTGQG